MTELTSPQIDNNTARASAMRNAVKEPVNLEDFDMNLPKVAAAVKHDAEVRAAIEKTGDNPFLTPSERKMDELGYDRRKPVYLLGAYAGRVVSPAYVDYNGNLGGGAPRNAQRVPSVVHN